jgi:hypothetical protein
MTETHLILGLFVPSLLEDLERITALVSPKIGENSE